ncbi:MAG: TetR/AcrR family transcriptional regulator [Bermanella sp.]
MTAQKSLGSTTRSPQQLRSKNRMNEILRATKNIMEISGSNNLRMMDIAKTANVTVSSIYQYFPNRAAIVKVLAQSYLNQWSEQVAKQVKQVSSADEIQGLVLSLINDFYQRYKYDSVLQDIWGSKGSDKIFENIDMEHHIVIQGIIYNKLKYLFDQVTWPKLETTILLSLHQGSAAIRLALTLDEKEGEKIMEVYTQQTLNAFNEFLPTKH